MGKGEGKGKGKGGCQEICDGLAAAVGCLCCLLVAGPVMVVVGIVVLASTSTDDRSQRIDEFNQLTEPWNSYGYEDFAQNTTFAASLQVTSISSPCFISGQITSDPILLSGGPDPRDNVESSSDRVDFQQWKYSTQLPNTIQAQIGSGNGCQLTVEIFRLNAASVQESTEQTTLGSMSGVIQQSIQRNICSSSDSDRTCRRRCQNNYDGTYNSFTNQCQYNQVLEGLCIKVDESKKGERDWQENSNVPGPGSGCYWNDNDNVFVEQKYENGGNIQGEGQLTIYVRSARDPYLNFLYVTDGSKSFGLTTGQKIAIGISLMGIGLLLISFWVLTIYCCCKYFYCNQRPSEAPGHPVGNFYYQAFNRYGQYVPGYQHNPQAPYAVQGQPIQPYGQQPQYQYPSYQQQQQQGYQYQPPGYPQPSQQQPVYDYNRPPQGYPSAAQGQNIYKYT